MNSPGTANQQTSANSLTVVDEISSIDNKNQSFVNDELETLYYQAAYFQRIGQIDAARVIYEKIQGYIGTDERPDNKENKGKIIFVTAAERARHKASFKKTSLSQSSVKKRDDIFKKALSAFNAEDFDVATLLFESVLKIDSHCLPALVNLAMIFFKKEDYDKSLEYSHQAIFIDPYRVSALNMVGLVLMTLGLLTESLEYFDKALAIDSDYQLAYLNKGNTLTKLNRLDDALLNLSKAIEISPSLISAYSSRGRLFMQMRRFKEAFNDFKQISTSGLDGIFLCVGIALDGLGRIEESVEYYDRQIASDASVHLAHNCKGGALLKLGRYPEAFRAFEQAIVAKPDYASAYWNLSLLLLLQGEYKLGWELYEWRWKKEEFQNKERFVKKQPWLGKEGIRGKTLLITEEQGFGDMIQFCRFALLAQDMGAMVYVEAQKPLINLFKSLSPAIRLVEKGQALPAFDHYCPMMSLPLAFQTCVETIPAYEHYLAVDPVRQKNWLDRLGMTDKLRVGIAWSGSTSHQGDAARSISFDEFSTLLSVDAEFHCLHKEFRKEDSERLAAFPQLRFWGKHIDDFADTAALISAMDVIVSVDTSVVHLAGALGKPTWVLLSFSPDFRWFINRDDSPWYPSVRLFRQQRLNDWSSVLNEIKRTLLAVTSEAEQPEPTEDSSVSGQSLSVDTAPATMVLQPIKKTVPCKICDTAAELYGVLDFNKNCLEGNGVYLPLAGVPVYYHQCTNCGLIFTAVFDKWISEDFASAMYNDEYIKVDPEYKEIRPSSNSTMVFDFVKKIGATTVLDYGGGQGRMAQLLRGRQVDCDSWDPMVASSFSPQQNNYDLVTSFEVFEHTPTPIETTQQILSFLHEDGLLLFSTLTIDNLPHRNIDFWYIAPRNGHITIHTKKSLTLIFGRFGWKVHHFSDGLHLAFKNKPNFLS
ncbi:methyltransferase domain-containing protein [Pollutimonas subterranea]|uniref:methyltransferase domain-containing protein n=1 Tax=Pollutimonas subterranea TaxID=2045210 RepID=UPI00130435FD|nr:methyltransferase domain-containing protein [Pollutimonas subterranea]